MFTHRGSIICCAELLSSRGDVTIMNSVASEINRTRAKNLADWLIQAALSIPDSFLCLCVVVHCLTAGLAVDFLCKESRIHLLAKRAQKRSSTKISISNLLVVNMRV